MNYDPGSKVDGGGKAEAGTYRFKIDEATEKTFNSGNEGLRLVLLVGAFPDRDVKVFENLMFLPQSLWRLEQCMNAVGLDFHDKSVRDHHFVGLTGMAKFKIGEKGYLEVEEFLPSSANNTGARKPANGVGRAAAQPPSDNVPW